MQCLNITDDSYTNFSPSQIDNLVDNTADSLRLTLDSIAPLKKKIIKQKRVAPWYNSQTRMLKQTSRKLERIWRSTKLEESRLVWLDSLKTYRKALCGARAAYYSSLIEENKNNPRFLFSTLGRLTKSHNSTDPCIPMALSSNDFINFFNDKILTIRDKINHLMPSIGNNLSSLETAVKPDIYLDCFSPIDLPNLTSTISSSKPSTCLLDSIPTKLLKEVLPLISTHLLDMINLSLLTGYVPQSFKVAVIKPLLKKCTTYLGV